MSNKTKKIISMILTLFLFIMFMTNIVYATNGFVGFDTFDNTPGSKSLEDASHNIAGTVINVIQIVGAGVSIIAIVLVAVKYMMAAPEEKASYKRSATIYIVGAILVFGATQVLGLIENFVGENIGK